MKINTRKLLLFLHSPEEMSNFSVKYEVLYQLFPDLTPVGVRTLIHGLVRKQFISSMRLGTYTSFALTALGRRVVEEEYAPFFQQSSREWQLVLLFDAPEFDPQFRSLQRLLAKEHVYPLQRGLLLSPFPISQALQQTLLKRYGQHMVVLPFKQTLFGNEEVIFQKKLQLKDKLLALSGISTQLDKMISKKVLFSSSKHQGNLSIFSLFDRIYSLVEESPDVFLFSTTTEHALPHLLSRFKKLFSPSDKTMREAQISSG